MNDNNNNDFLDVTFYRNSYSNLQHLDDESLTRHYEIHGKKRGRYANLGQLVNTYKKRIIDEQERIKILTINNGKQEEKIHIILRTHLREENFMQLMNEVMRQNYSNFTIHIVYDHEDSLKYIEKYSKLSEDNEEFMKNKTIIHKMHRNSNGSCFFDLYCEKIKNSIEDGWIMMLDDDNCFIHDNALAVINNYLTNNKTIVLWNFLRLDQCVRSNPFKLTYGEVDNCSFIFHNSVKYDGTYGDTYGSDFPFIDQLLSKYESVKIDHALVYSQNINKVSHAKDYENDDTREMFIHSSRIDFDDYKNYHTDFQGRLSTVEQLRNHYENHGKYESRMVKFNSFDFETFEGTINHFNTFHVSTIKFTLITSLYNVKDSVRLKEFKLVLEHWQKNQFIEQVIVFYEKNSGKNEELSKVFESLSKVQVTNTHYERPSFYTLFNHANKWCFGKNIIVCNADIIFDHTLYKFQHTDFNNKIYALTRWEFIDEYTPTPRKQYGEIMHSSKDTWIFKSPIQINERRENLMKIKIGTWDCENQLFKVLNDKIMNE